jgi:DNA (cytosine-5)-methyltransferase 1
MPAFNSLPVRGDCGVITGGNGRKPGKDSSAQRTMLDLFAGAGGLSLGFGMVGFRSVFAVESDASAAATYAANFGGHVHSGLIEEVQSFGAAEIVVGGPPCQGFSPLGRDRDDHSRHALNTLWRQYLRAVQQVRPKVFVVENVPEFLKSGQFQVFLETLATDPLLSDYVVEYRVLKAAEYGVPQTRRRGFVIGSRIGPPIWPTPTHGPVADPPRPFRNVRDAIGDLPLEPTDDDLQWRRHPTAMSLERYKSVPEGGNRFDLARNRPDLLPDCWRNKKSGTTDVFGRLRWDAPALTIRTEFFKPEKGCYLHPAANRPITHRDAARLQTFPDDFKFIGTKVQIARQIGNAVPPVLARAVAAAVLARLLDPIGPASTVRSPGVRDTTPASR